MKIIEPSKLVLPVQPKMLIDSHKMFYDKDIDSEEAIKLKRKADLYKKKKPPRLIKTRGFLTSKSSFRLPSDFVPFSEPLHDQKQFAQQQMKKRFVNKLTHKNKCETIRAISTRSTRSLSK